MGLRLIKEDERLPSKLDDECTIYYRRIPNRKRAAIVEKHTKRGATNWVAATNEILEYSILSWEGAYVIDEDDKRRDVPYSTEQVRMIPDKVQADLMDEVGENTDEGGQEAKNSGTTSGSKGTTKGTRAPSVGSKP